MKDEDFNFYPICINLQKFPCLVVGGGKVALRKVLSLQEFNANITVISPNICKPLIILSKEGKIKVIKKSYSKEFIKDYKIVFSATNNPEINKSVYTDCASEDILLNVVDDPSLCDFILPANLKRGNLTISISSQGKAPFYVKEIKKKLSHIISPHYAEITDLAGDFRKRLINNFKINSPKIKEKAFNKFLSIDWEKILHKQGKEYSRRHLLKILKEFK